VFFESPGILLHCTSHRLTGISMSWDDSGFTKGGEILHVLGLRLFLAEHALLPLSKADVVRKASSISTMFLRQRNWKFRPPVTPEKLAFKDGMASEKANGG
jgi:hypothetical protein